MIHQKELAAAMRALARGEKKPNKYAAVPQIADGYRFDSTREHERYQQLRLLERAGEIRNLHIHPVFPIEWPTNGAKICVVELDFKYIDRNGAVHHEDVKGVDTALSRVKRKLVEAAYNLTVELIK
jgi:hypothetical protein